jgi:hypothetical protein
MSVVDETATETATAYTTHTTHVEDAVYCDIVWACLLNDYLLDGRETALDQNEEDGSAKGKRRKKKKKKGRRVKAHFPDYPSLADDEEDSEVKEKAGEDEPLQNINVDDIYDIRQIRSLDDSAKNKSSIAINHIPEEAETLIEQIVRQTRSLDDSAKNKSSIAINHIPEEAETLVIDALKRKNMSLVLRHSAQEEGSVVRTRTSTSRFIKRDQSLGYIEDGPELASHSRPAGYVEIESARHPKRVATRRAILSDDERQHKSSPTPYLSDDSSGRSSSRSGVDSRRSHSHTGDPHVPVPISSHAPASVEIKPTVTRRPIQDRTDDHAHTIYPDEISTKSSKSERSRSRSPGPPKSEELREPESPDPPVDRMGTQDHPIEVGSSKISTDMRETKTYDDRVMLSRSSRDWGAADFVTIEKTKKDEKKTLKVYNDDAILQRLTLKKEKEEHIKRRLERKAALSRIRVIKKRLLLT